MNNINEFITIGRTKCYFIDSDYHIQMAVIIGYNKINDSIKLNYKLSNNNYLILYRTRDTIWFNLETCLLYLIELLKNKTMKTLKIIDLSLQLDGINNILHLNNPIGNDYTIYYNGLRQNRDDYIVDNNNLTLTILIDPLPNENDILTIEYWNYDAAEN